jgi:hypothetical protein
MSYEKWLLLPVVLHVVMTMLLGVYMGRARFRGVGDGRVQRQDIVNNTKAWPPDILKIGNNFDNQFQLPMSWYACVAFILITGSVSRFFVWLSWVFLVSRAMHAIEHIGSNIVQRRFVFYLVGYLVLTIMWVWFAISYFVIG